MVHSFKLSVRFTEFNIPASGCRTWGFEPIVSCGIYFSMIFQCIRSIQRGSRRRSCITRRAALRLITLDHHPVAGLTSLRVRGGTAPVGGWTRGDPEVSPRVVKVSISSPNGEAAAHDRIRKDKLFWVYRCKKIGPPSCCLARRFHFRVSFLPCYSFRGLV